LRAVALLEFSMHCFEFPIARRLLAAWLLAVLSLGAVQVVAQHGHPLVGSWSGDWGRNQTERSRLLVTFEFGVDQVISGFIIENGTRTPFETAVLDPSAWAITITAERSTSAGAVPMRIEGVIENLGSATGRRISGTWVEGDVRGDFQLSIN